MSASNIELLRDGAIARLIINRPERRNALNQSMWETLDTTLNSIASDPSIRVVIVTGSGGCFSAGADISEFRELAADPERLRANNAVVQRAQEKLEELPRPTIAMIEGACVGGGCGIALACDFRIASTDAVFAITPARLGLIYSLRDTRRLLSLVGPAFTKEMLYTSRKLDSQEAVSRGLINRAVVAEQLPQTVDTLAQELATTSQYSVRGVKQVVAALEGYGTLDEAATQALFDNAFTADDCREGVAAFMEKRQPIFTWG